MLSAKFSSAVHIANLPTKEYCCPMERTLQHTVNVNVSPEMLRLFQAVSFELAAKCNDDRKIGCTNSPHTVGN